MIAFVFLMLAVALDWWGVGNGSWRDRVAFGFVILGSFAAWSTTDVSRKASAGILNGVRATAEIFDIAMSNRDAVILVGMIATLLVVIGIMALLPDDSPGGMGGPGGGPGGKQPSVLKKLSNQVSLAPKSRRRINPRVWLIGVPIGILAPTADIPGMFQLLLSSAPAVAVQFVSAVAS